MRFEALDLPGAYRIVAEPRHDTRGSFTQLFEKNSFETRNLVGVFAQYATSNNKNSGTLRGMHFQAAPHQEAKLVRCTRGSIFDVMVDMRKDSPTYLKHYGETLTPNEPVLLYIPAGFAHGYLTLEDESDIEYHISQPYHEALQRGLRWNDPKLNIAWPGDVKVIAERDANYPDWS